MDARAAEPAGRAALPEVLSRGVPAQLTPRRPRPPAARCACARPPRRRSTIEPREGDGGAERDGRRRAGAAGTCCPAVATRATGPLGLARWDHAAGEEAEVRVFPDLQAARRLALAVARGRFRDQGATARGPLGLGTEFELIRDYEPDDDIRQVNWRATARLGRPMSNQYRLEQDRDLLLLIDAGPA